MSVEQRIQETPDARLPLPVSMPMQEVRCSKVVFAQLYPARDAMHVGGT